MRLETSVIPQEIPSSTRFLDRAKTSSQTVLSNRLSQWLAPYRWRMALAVALGVGTILAGIGLMTASSLLISQAGLHPSIAKLSLIIVGVRFFGLSRAALRYLERLVSHDLTFRLLARLRVWFYARLEPLAPARLLEHRSGDLLARIVADVDSLQNLYLRAISPAIVALIVSGLSCAGLAIFDLRLALCAAGFLGLCGLGVPWLTARSTRGLGRRQLELRAALSAALVDDLQGLEDALALGAEGPRQARLEDLNRQLEIGQARQARVGSLSGGLALALANLGALSVLALAVPLVSDGRLDGVWLAALALGTLASFEAVQGLGAAWMTLEQAGRAAEGLLEVIDAEPTLRDPAQPLELPANPSLRLENLSFAYGNETVLEGVSLCLEPGKRTVLIGPSGAGKSTIAKLIVRFLEPSAGRALLGGHELGAYRQHDLRRAVALVSQHTQVFNTTIRQNLLIARPDATDAQLEFALSRARLLEFVRAQPEGLDTWVGESGARLSGGERQRLGIARVLLRDAPVLVLDEPSANLDASNASQVLEALRDLSRNGLEHGRAVLEITHRLEGLEGADEIVLLERGRVIERGTQAALLLQPGRYARLIESQRRTLT